MPAEASLETMLGDQELPSYISKESFLRLSPYAQGKVVELLTAPPKPPPAAYLNKEDRFKAAGYTDYIHYQISGILEQLDY
jgi:hypothetical protein